MYERILRNRVVAIFRNLPLTDLIPAAEALCDAGVKSLEVTANSLDWTQGIRRLRTHFGSEIAVGAGTILDPETAAVAADAGAEFLLTPNTDERVLLYCAQNEIALVPGVMTASDVGLCLRYGYGLMKLFPAGILPKEYIKQLKGPFGQSNYIAVGGVTKENARQFIDAGFVGVGMGSSLLRKELIAEKDWQGLKYETLALINDVNYLH